MYSERGIKENWRKRERAVSICNVRRQREEGRGREKEIGK